MKKIIKLINNERIHNRVRSLKADAECSTGAVDICYNVDNIGCTIYAYDKCSTTDLTACTEGAQDICGIDYASCIWEKKTDAVSEWVFPHYPKPTDPLHPSLAYNKLKSVLKKLDLPLLRFHDLRHTFATHATDGGVDPKTLAGILGHTDASFTVNVRNPHTNKM